MGELEGRIAVVTGGARGIGKAICETLAREGASVAVCDVDYKTAEKTAEEIKASGFSAFSFALDVSSAKNVDEVFSEIIGKYGKVDILVNNAGICYYVPIEKITEEEWDKVLAVNLKGTFLCSKAVMHSMMAQRWGKIVNISSVAAKIGGILAGAHYSASKAGVICLTKSFALRLAPYNINVNAICPGQIRTRMTDIWTEEEKKKFIEKIPLGHFGEPQDIAEAVLFLVSERAKFITGEILDVNGGIFMD